MKFLKNVGVEVSAPMKLMRATFPVGEGIWSIAAIFECIGLNVL